MLTSIIERELADKPLVTLCKYVRFIILFHFHHFLQEEIHGHWEEMR